MYNRIVPATRDVYANLLRDTRGLRREQARSRDAWYDRLDWERKEETLFELEMLLKGFACFGNQRNLPGVPSSAPPVAHDFREELRIVRDALSQSIVMVRQLLGSRDRAYVFSRYLESVLPEDALRSRLVRDQLSQDTPEESLFVLRNTFSNFLEIIDGILRHGRVTHRLYTAVLGMIVREIGRNTFFDPLVALEFRPEFDRIRTSETLEALHAASDSGHKVAAVAFLALYRGLRYVQLIDHYAERPDTTRRAYVILSVLRSDMRALTRYLGQRSAEQIAVSFEKALLSVPAHEIDARREVLAREAGRLISLRSTLENLANVVRVEVRHTFERDLPPPVAAVAQAELGPQLVVASASLRATLHHAIETLCRELRPEADVPSLGSVDAARAQQSERLRRDVWMFLQVLRAFLAKAEAARGDPDQWASYASFRFVREFLGHFRAIGYQLVRSSDYARLDRFLAALEELRDVDLLEADRMRAAVEECTTFYRYLEKLFDQISKRVELTGKPFNKKAAVETLRIYLGAA